MLTNGEADRALLKVCCIAVGEFMTRSSLEETGGLWIDLRLPLALWREEQRGEERVAREEGKGTMTGGGEMG